jgi:polyether ionophore transport system permease protein
VSQIAADRRPANGIAALILGVAYAIRMVADGGTGLGWMRWLSPLGWVENLAPLTDPQPLAFLPIVAVIASAVAGALVLAGRRDVGAGVFVERSRDSSRLTLLGGPLAFAVRLERWVALGWVAALTLVAVVFGFVARAAAAGGIGDNSVGAVVGQRSGAAAWVGYEFLYLGAILAFAAAGQVSAMRNEEAEGHLDHLLVRPVSRRQWLAGRVLVAAVLVLAAGLAAGVGGWLGVGGTDGVDATMMLRAGFNSAVPGLFVLGLGTMLFGVVPRVAAAALYAVVVWSFLVEIIGSTLSHARWLHDSSVLAHLGPVPATDLHWSAIA